MHLCSPHIDGEVCRKTRSRRRHGAAPSSNRDALLCRPHCFEQATSACGGVRQREAPHSTSLSVRCVNCVWASVTYGGLDVWTLLRQGREKVGARKSRRSQCTVRFRTRQRASHASRVFRPVERASDIVKREIRRVTFELQAETQLSTRVAPSAPPPRYRGRHSTTHCPAPSGAHVRRGCFPSCVCTLPAALALNAEWSYGTQQSAWYRQASWIQVEQLCKSLPGALERARSSFRARRAPPGRLTGHRVHFWAGARAIQSRARDHSAAQLEMTSRKGGQFMTRGLLGHAFACASVWPRVVRTLASARASRTTRGSKGPRNESTRTDGSPTPPASEQPSCKHAYGSGRAPASLNLVLDPCMCDDPRARRLLGPKPSRKLNTPRVGSSPLSRKPFRTLCLFRSASWRQRAAPRASAPLF